MQIIEQTLKLNLFILSFSLASLFAFSGEGISQTNSSSKKLAIEAKGRNIEIEAGSVEQAHLNGAKNIVVASRNATKDKPFVNSLGMKFVPAVTYANGKKVYFSIWETRVRDYRAFVNATGHSAEGGAHGMENLVSGEAGISWKNPLFPIDENHCVTCVNWYDAKAFAKWLTLKERKEGLIGSNQKYRLPTDIEWSYAVGIGEEQGNTPYEKGEGSKLQKMNQKAKYPWGNYWPPKEGKEGNYLGKESYWGNMKSEMKPSEWITVKGGYRDQHPRTAPVGSYCVNKYGLYDMGGNVNEWCEDRRGGAGAGQKYRVLRGGSWVTDRERALRSAFRGAIYPSLRADCNGFRVVLE